MIPDRFTTSTVALMAVFGCGRGESASASATSAGGGAPSARAASTVRAVKPPSDACGWLTVDEVETVTGKLAGPPRAAGNECHYPLPLDPIILERKTRNREIDRKLLGPNAPSLRDPNWDRTAIIVKVDLHTTLVSERGSRTDGGNGWDRVRRTFGAFDGRIGHVAVIVSENDETDRAIPMEKKEALAALVRDNVPDVVFANPNGDMSTYLPSLPDPCQLLTRPEAEAMLGTLVADPYRIGETEPFAESNGKSCGYATKHHHVLVVTPSWSDGKSELRSLRGISNLVSAVAAEPNADAADTLEGAWDQAATDLDGSLVFLEGDRLLRIEYGTSTIDVAAAIQLARRILPRLASATPR